MVQQDAFISRMFINMITNLVIMNLIPRLLRLFNNLIMRELLRFRVLQQDIHEFPKSLDFLVFVHFFYNILISHAYKLLYLLIIFPSIIIVSRQVLQ